MISGKLTDLALRPFDELNDRRESRRSFPDGIDRMYCYHVRKTGGTSLHRSVMSLGGEDAAAVHARLAESRRWRTRTGDLVVQAHRRAELSRGKYSYGWSHRPAYTVHLPPRSFTITVLRDPVDRVVSHYRMLRDDSMRRYPFPPPEREFAWAQHGWSAFLENIPRQHLLRQLYMFSPHEDVDEATAALQRCSLVFRLERMSHGLETLADLFGQPLAMHWERRSAPVSDVGPSERAELATVLQAEYRLLHNLGLEG